MFLSCYQINKYYRGISKDKIRESEKGRVQERISIKSNVKGAELSERNSISRIIYGIEIFTLSANFDFK